MVTVSVADLAEALKWLGNVVYCDPNGTNQAFLCSDVSFVGHFDVDPANRSVNDEWVREMKKEIVALHAKNEMMTLTAAIDKRTIAAFIHAKDNDEDLGMFKAILLDGQHRWTALKQLRDEKPKVEFKFFLIVYIVESDDEIRQRLLQLNKRREFTTSDAAEVDGRLKFLKAWNQSTLGSENRVCVRRIRNHELLRNASIVKCLMKMSESEIHKKLYEIASSYEGRYKASSDRFKKSVAGQIIRSTGLYQLVNEDGQWLEEICNSNSTSDVIVLDD
jgi:hypothetical protein